MYYSGCLLQDLSRPWGTRKEWRHCPTRQDSCFSEIGVPKAILLVSLLSASVCLAVEDVADAETTERVDDMRI